MTVPSPSITCVLFDFAWTLFAGDPDAWVRGAAARIGCPVAPGEPEMISAEFAERLRATATDPDHIRRDLDTEIFDRALPAILRQIPGVDPEFAAALFENYMPSLMPFADVHATLTELRSRNVRVGVVSNFGRDIRPAFVRHGLDGLVDAFVISYEVGFVKPEPEMWRTALKIMQADPEETLMVGDHAAGDGGAIVAGITALVLPLVPAPQQPRGLDRVLKLVQPN
jgi:HAD superfamily hydrolase (TIGR01509 family)